MSNLLSILYIKNFELVQSGSAGKGNILFLIVCKTENDNKSNLCIILVINR